MISIAKNFCHRKLSQLLTISKNSELSLTHENFLPTKYTRLSAFTSQLVVSNDCSNLFGGESTYHGLRLAHLIKIVVG